jgi:hypothetical protein
MPATTIPKLSIRMGVVSLVRVLDVQTLLHATSIRPSLKMMGVVSSSMSVGCVVVKDPQLASTAMEPALIPMVTRFVMQMRRDAQMRLLATTILTR